MATIETRYNNGKGLKVGETKVNSFNVKPEQVTAVASPGTLITLSDVKLYEWFAVAQDSAATDIVLLPDGADVGTVIVINAVDVFVVTVEDATETINTVVDGDVTTVAGDVLTFTKVNDTSWVATKVSSAGAATTVVPA